MITPVRLQLSRKRGFNLQELSLATNGLPAVNVARPTKWGNPFLVHPTQKSGRVWGLQYFSVPTVEDAVECFREMFTHEGPTADGLNAALPELRGHNLACWCKPGLACHADVLLRLCEEVR